MKINKKDPPRTFEVGIDQSTVLSDCGEVYLEPNEQVTFKTHSEGEYDFVRKDWGFYASPSLNSRLLKFNLRAVLVKNVTSKHYYILVVERGKEASFDLYCDTEHLKVVVWMDNQESLDNLSNYNLVT